MADTVKNNLSHESLLISSNSVGIANEIRSDRLRSKLDNVDKNFLGFEESILDTSRKKKNLIEARLQETHEIIKQVEKNLNNEIRRRVETNKELHQLIEQLSNEMFARVHKRVQKRIEKLTVTFETLISRSEKLENQVTEFKGNLPDSIEVTTVQLMREIRAFHEDLKESGKAILDKDNLIFKRFSELEYNTHTKLESEVTLQQEQINDVSSYGNKIQEDNAKRDEHFKSFISREIENLKDGLVLTSKAREQSDEQILQAINHCAGALQKGLEGSYGG